MGRPTKPRHKTDDKVNNKKIVRFITSLGTIHLYKVECLKCGDISTMSEPSLKRTVGCKKCYRKKLKDKSFETAQAQRAK